MATRRDVFLPCLSLAAGACNRQPPAPAGAAKNGAAADWFTDVAQATGLDFTHFNGM